SGQEQSCIARYHSRVSTAYSWKLLVFREGRSVRSGPELLAGLIGQIDTVLRAGELECALADQHGSGSEAKAVAEVADQLASALLTKERPQISPNVIVRLRDLRVPQSLTVSTPEGFCYYALHPLDYADLLSETADYPPAAAVVGIRSIGTTLSATVQAWFSVHGINAERIS